MSYSVKSLHGMNKKLGLVARNFIISLLGVVRLCCACCLYPEVFQFYYFPLIPIFICPPGDSHDPHLTDEMEAEKGRADQQNQQNCLESRVLFSDPPNVGVGVARGGGGGPTSPGDRGEAGQTAVLLPSANTCQDATSTISQGSRQDTNSIFIQQ